MVAWMRMAFIGWYIWMLCVQLAELVCEGLECGIVEEGELLGARLKISRVHAISSVPLCLLLVDEDIVS